MPDKPALGPAVYGTIGFRCARRVSLVRCSILFLRPRSPVEAMHRRVTESCQFDNGMYPRNRALVSYLIRLFVA
eukprot:6211930-Pleurochrysis_carterae.AAC.1